MVGTIRVDRLCVIINGEGQLALFQCGISRRFVLQNLQQQNKQNASENLGLKFVQRPSRFLEIHTSSAVVILLRFQ